MQDDARALETVKRASELALQTGNRQAAAIASRLQMLADREHPVKPVAETLQDEIPVVEQAELLELEALRVDQEAGDSPWHSERLGKALDHYNSCDYEPRVRRLQEQLGESVVIDGQVEAGQA